MSRKRERRDATTTADRNGDVLVSGWRKFSFFQMNEEETRTTAMTKRIYRQRERERERTSCLSLSLTRCSRQTGRQTDKQAGQRKRVKENFSWTAWGDIYTRFKATNAEEQRWKKSGDYSPLFHSFDTISSPIVATEVTRLSHLSISWPINR